MVGLQDWVKKVVRPWPRACALLAATLMMLGMGTPASAGTNWLDQWYQRGVNANGSLLSAVAFGANTFVAVGSANGQNAVFTSSDGVTWTSRNSATGSGLEDVAYGNGTFVAVGANGTVLTSPDGGSWISQGPGFGNNLDGVAYGNSTFVAVGEMGIVLTSTNGVTWAIQVNVTGNTLNGVAWGNDTFVAVGENGFVQSSSPDGWTWTSRKSGTGHYLYGVTYGNGTFVAVGQSGTVLTSPDGVTWTPRSSGTINSLNGVAYGNGAFVAVGGGGTILTSPDGVTWTVRNSGTTSNLLGTANGQNTFVAVGDNGTVIQSANPTIPTIILSPRPQPPFTFLPQQAATPTANPPNGSTVADNVVVTLADATPGATIYFTTDGSTPTTSSSSGTSVSISGAPGSTVTVKALAVATGYSDSAVATFSYTLPQPVASPPSVTGISPATGPAGTAVTITGTGLATATGVNFGNVPASSYKPGSDTSLTAVAPAGSGTVDITVDNPAGWSATSANDQFAYSQATQSGQTIMYFYIGNSDYWVGTQLKSMDTVPIIEDGRTLLPIRYVTGPLGAVINWDSAAQKLTISLNGKTIELWINQSTATVNGVNTSIDPDNPDVAPIIVPPGRTMLPLRFIAENLGAQVGWNQAQQEVTVTYPAGQGTP